MTRVLVTGTGGFLGSHLVEALIELTDWDVVAIDSFRHNGAIDRLYDALKDDVRVRTSIYPHDLRVPLSPRQLELIGDVDVIIDAASRCSVDESIHDPVNFVLNNVSVTLEALELARLKHVDRLIHISTDEVYGARAARTLTDHRPSSPYSASKAAQEDFCHAYARTYGVPVTIVTSGNMFGERQSQLAFLPRIVRALLRDEVISVHVRDGVPGERHYSYAGDVARWIVNSLLENVYVEQDHSMLAGRYQLSNLELVERVATILNRPFAVELIEATHVRPGADHSYQPPLSDDGWLDDDVLVGAPLDDRLGRTAWWFAKHPDWLATR